MNAIEAGRMVPSVLLALKLARVLGVSVETLFSVGGETEARPADRPRRASGL